MSAIRIRKLIDSDTLTLPELRGFIGRTVEIVIEEPAPATTAEQFWAYAANLPATEAEFAVQQEQFRAWRGDPQFEPHWPTIDRLLARDFEKTRRLADVNKSLRQMTDYDFEAYKTQREFDAKDAENPQ